MPSKETKSPPTFSPELHKVVARLSHNADYDGYGVGNLFRGDSMHKSSLRSLIAFTVVLGFLTITAPLFAAGKESLLYSFNDNGADGYNPYSSLVFDTKGNLYGTTAHGGAHNGGTVFQLTPENGAWTETIIYSFCSVTGCTDGLAPYAGLTFDTAGNLYGTTLNGGAYTSACEGSGCGTVFELSPGTNGTWTENVLYNFCSVRGCADGFGPQAGLISDAAGSLFGTTYAGGSSGKGCDGYGCGTVFRLTLGAKGKWKEHVLHKFKPKATDGYWPYAGLIFDASGNLYGTTIYGGAYANGTVFEITP